jgi:hypothetical protein
MTSIIGRINEDYENYKSLCSLLSETPLSIKDEKSFYDHREKLLEKYNCESMPR